MIDIINKWIKKFLTYQENGYKVVDFDFKHFAISILEKQYEELKEIKGEYAIDELEYHKEKLQKDIKQLSDPTA